jgi:hypothetical protein
MNYDLFEHRHRFAAWAAARAAQRAFAEVEVLRSALESSAIVAYLRHSAAAEVDEVTFDRLHNGWCTDVLVFLRDRGLHNATFGRAAKLIAVYLKSMVVAGPYGQSELSRVAHPPIDRLLLQNLARANRSDPRSRRWRTTNWTELDQAGYYRLITELRNLLPCSEPFWKLEEHWNVTPSASSRGYAPAETRRARR